MTYNPDIHNRRSIRLKGYDYSQGGLYFITICTQNHKCLFGIIVGAGSKPALSDYGQDIAYTPSVTIQNINKSAVVNRAGLEPAPTQNVLNVENDQNTKAGLEHVPTKMQLNEYGVIVENTWVDLKNHNDQIKLHEFVIMPNHVHGIIEIVNTKTKPISEIVRQLKTFSAKRINQLRKKSGVPLWQRNYYEHVIRDENSYQKISEYILNNPLKWQEDKYFA